MVYNQSELKERIQLQTRLNIKIVLILLLFIEGLIIAAIIFPVLGFIGKRSITKTLRDGLKRAWLKQFATILGLRIITEGGPPEKTCLWVSNHISWLDIIVLGSFTPAHFVAKNDIAAWPVIGFLAKQGGTVFIRRGDKQQAKATIEAMTWLLKQASTVIAFPEGTTTKGDVILPFHASLFQSALLTRSAIQPVAIRYIGQAEYSAPFIGDDDFITHLLKMLKLDKIEVCVKFLPLVVTAGKTRQSLSYQTRAMIMESVTGDSLEDTVLTRQQQLYR